MSNDRIELTVAQQEFVDWLRSIKAKGLDEPIIHIKQEEQLYPGGTVNVHRTIEAHFHIDRYHDCTGCGGSHFDGRSSFIKVAWQSRGKTRAYNEAGSRAGSIEDAKRTLLRNLRTGDNHRLSRPGGPVEVTAA